MVPSTSALHRTIYLSSAVGVLRADELDRILLRAKASNSRAGITGLLVMCDGTFLQALEGPPAGVASLMQKIRRDRRHTTLVILESGPCERRAYADSPLHYVAARNLTLGEKQAFASLRAVFNARPMLGGAMAGADLRLESLLDSFRAPRTA